MTDESLRALPRDVPDYHARQAAHLRALAVNATPTRLKARLLDQAEQHDRLTAPDVALNPSFIVRIDRKPGAFGDTMNEIRSWLDYRHIHPASFAPVAPAASGVGFEISFKSEGEARLFEHAFRASSRLPIVR